MQAQWCCDGKQLTKEGNVQISEDKVVASTTVLVLRLDPGKKPGEYVNKKQCMQWLMDLHGEKFWDSKMEAWEG